MEQPWQFVRYIVYTDGGKVLLDDCFPLPSHEGLMTYEEDLLAKYDETVHNILRTEDRLTPARKLAEAALRGGA